MTKMSKVTVVLAMAGAIAFGVSARAGDDKPAGDVAKAKGVQHSPEEMFQKMDANNDGMVSKDEFVAAQEARAKEAGREAPAKEGIEKRFAALDINNDGNLTKDEFTAGFAKMKGEHGRHAEGAARGEKHAEHGAK